MCETSPGVRCAADTRLQAASMVATYHRAYPDGPTVDPIGSARAAMAASRGRHTAIAQAATTASAASAAGAYGSYAQLQAVVQRQEASRVQRLMGRADRSVSRPVTAQVDERLWAMEAAVIGAR